MPRNEEDVLAGVLRLRIRGQERDVRVLSVAESRKWKLAAVAALGSGIGGMSLDSVDDFGSVATAAGDRILDLVVAYDVDSTLGGREYLEANATDPELYAALRAMLEASFPFVRDLRSVLAELRALGLAELLSGRSPAPSSTSSPSENGTSAVLVASSES